MRNVNQSDWGRLLSMLQRPGVVVSVDVEDLQAIRGRSSRIVEGASHGEASHIIAASQALAQCGSSSVDVCRKKVLVVLESRFGNLVAGKLREMVALVRQRLQAEAVLLVAAVVPDMSEDARVAIIF